ncbi:tripartite motif-containing 13 isoform X1 [Thunnus albacares]|uniref:tripartite motif-containing 13 isoform X1 n=2 Tax=Thunnus maccoyii TaxID=8240 RepID=UPI001C4BDCA6|nr:tripartite motif-containing 13 isoform X1 [Thunnus maccoyii]XP_044221551.1 tripartite motif-containing 13 isoform X1 [Thunnus albacares]
MIALHCASQQLDTMEQLEEELTCPICCCLFEDPRVLLCSHSFCKKCLEGLLEGNRGPAFRTPFKCPTCRKESPHNGANSLQINYSLRGIVEKYSKIKVLPKMSVCQQHSGQPLNIFCATDLKLICGFCATTGDHKGHKFCSLEEAYEREKDAFEELLQGAESWQSADILSCLETLQASKKKALQSVNADAEKVTDYFDKLVSALECKKNEILCDFETLKLVVMQAYDPEITKLSAALEEQRRALSIAESFRSVSDPLCFLQQMQEFRQKLQVLKETPLPSRKDMDAGPLVRNFDVKKWDSLRLREVDKISVPHEGVSYRAGGSRMAARRWITLLMSLLVPTLLLLQPHNLAAYVPSHIEPFLAAVSSHLTHTGVYLREMTDVYISLMGAGQECIVNFIDSTVNFIGSCKLF